MEYTIETEGLTKHYGQVKAVDAIDLHVKQGEIYGFLGLNGAGKTTMIRALLGMIHPNSGFVRLLGKQVDHNGRGPWERVGHMVEMPAAYPDLTVIENLEVARRLHGIKSKSVLFNTLEQLELTEYIHRKAGNLSSGNLQRLGLARAMLHEPELLLLDEPTNGLDPAGVVEIRNLLSTLAREKGTTIFMSSHILTEVDRMATRIGIIHKGRLIEELNANKMEQMRNLRLEISTQNNIGACQILMNAGFKVQRTNDTLIVYEEKAIQMPESVAVLLVKGGVPPSRLVVEQEDLEEYFLRLTGAER